jgi:hypothetical protein
MSSYSYWLIGTILLLNLIGIVWTCCLSKHRNLDLNKVAIWLTAWGANLLLLLPTWAIFTTSESVLLGMVIFFHLVPILIRLGLLVDVSLNNHDPFSAVHDHRRTVFALTVALILFNVTLLLFLEAS